MVRLAIYLFYNFHLLIDSAIHSEYYVRFSSCVIREVFFVEKQWNKCSLVNINTSAYGGEGTRKVFLAVVVVKCLFIV